MYPLVVQREQLGEANSKLGVSNSLAEIAGPPIGGLLVQLISAPLAVAFDALSFLVSAVFVGRITAPEQRPPASGGENALVEVAQGLRAIAVEPLLRAMLATGVTAGLAGGIIGALYDLYLARELGFSPAVIGLTIGVGGMSALLGALVAQPLVARFGLGPTMVLAATASGAAAALLPLARGPLALPLILLSQASDASYAVYFILATTLRQSITPDRLLGRVGAGFDLLPLGALLLGTLLAAALSDMFGLRAAIAIGAAGVFVANAWLWFSPLPRLRSVTASKLAWYPNRTNVPPPAGHKPAATGSRQCMLTQRRSSRTRCGSVEIVPGQDLRTTSVVSPDAKAAFFGAILACIAASPLRDTR